VLVSQWQLILVNVYIWHHATFVYYQILFTKQTQIIWNARTQTCSSGIMLNVENFRNQKLFTIYGIVSKKLISSVVIIVNRRDICWCRGCLKEILPSSVINWHKNSEHKKYNLRCQKCYDHGTRVAALPHVLTRQHNKPMSSSACQHQCLTFHSDVKLCHFILFSEINTSNITINAQKQRQLISTV